MIAVIGHTLLEDDVVLAGAGSGFDLVLGTHSHRLQELTSERDLSSFELMPTSRIGQAVRAWPPRSVH